MIGAAIPTCAQSSEGNLPIIEQPKDQIESRKELDESFFEWVSSSNATAFSFILNLTMFFLTLFGFYLYHSQKKEYKLLTAIMEDFGLKQKVQTEKSKAQVEYKQLAEEKINVKNQIKEAEKDLKERLPNEAKKAYYSNTIPVVERQIFDLSNQLTGMKTDLENLEGTSKPTSPVIKEILANEIKKRLTIKSEIENTQLILAILTGSVASIGIILPFPINLLAVPLAVAVLRQCLKLYKLWKQQTAANKK